MAESQLVTAVEAWGDWVNPQEYLADDPSFGYPSFPVSIVGDRDDGGDRRLIETESELGSIRGQARILFDTSPHGKAALENLRNYVIGEGFQYEVTPAEEMQVDPRLVRAVQRELNRFLDDVDWCGSREKEGELLTRTVRDGESFLALSVSGKDVTLRFVDPEMVVKPTSPRDWEEVLSQRGLTDGEPLSCSWGIITPEDDVQHVYGYHVQWTQGTADTDFLPHYTVEHLKLNTDSNVKRGVSDFYPVREDVLRESKLIRNVAHGLALQAAIAWVQEMPVGSTQAGTESMVAGKSMSSRTTTAANGGTAHTRHRTEYQPGTRLYLPSGAKFVNGPMGGQQTPIYLEGAKYLVRRVGVRWCMPEYMISADASNSNYASSLVAEAPFVKARQADQRYYSRRFRNVMWKVLRLLTRLGRFTHVGIGSGDYARLEEALDLNVVCPDVATRDEEKTARVRDIEFRNGIISRKTWQQETGRDPDVEAAQGAVATQPQPQQGQPAMPGEPKPEPQPTQAAPGLSLNGAQITAAAPSLEHGQKCGCVACTAARTAVEYVAKDGVLAKQVVEIALKRAWEGYP